MVVGLAAIVLSIRLFQNVVLSNINKDLDKAKATLSSPEYNKREGLVIILKNRLESIGNLLGQETYGSYAFQLVRGMVPEDVKLSSFSIDSKGVILLTAETNNIASLENFLNLIVTPDSNQKKVTAVSIEGINRGRSDVYRTELKVLLVGAKPK